jgi:UDP-glucose 4-epimerase
MIDIEQAVDLIEHALQVTGYNIIPNLKSFNVRDLFEIYQEEFGLKYELGEPRISEKLHEMMISKEEVPRAVYDYERDIYLMHYKNTNLSKFDWQEFTSDITVVSKQELKTILQHYGYFKQ